MKFNATRLQKETIWLVKFLIQKHTKGSQRHKLLKKFNNNIHNCFSQWFIKLVSVKNIEDIRNYVEDFFECHLSENEFEKFLCLGWLLDDDHLWIINDCFESFGEFEYWLNENIVPKNFWDKSIDCLKPKKMFGLKWKIWKMDYEKKYFPKPYLINKILHSFYQANCEDEYWSLIMIEEMFPMIDNINEVFYEQYSNQKAVEEQLNSIDVSSLTTHLKKKL